MVSEPRTVPNVNAVPIDRADFDRVITAARQRGFGDSGPGFVPQPRKVTPWRHCGGLLAGWVSDRVVGWWLGRLDRRMARLERMGR